MAWQASAEQADTLSECVDEQKYSCLDCEWHIRRGITGLYCFVLAVLVFLSALRWTFFLEDFGFLTKSYGRAGYYLLTATFFMGSGVEWGHLQNVGDVFDDWRNVLTLLGAFAIGCVGVINLVVHVIPCGGVCTDGTIEQVILAMSTQRCPIATHLRYLVHLHACLDAPARMLGIADAWRS